MKVALVLMVKNEVELLEAWLEYHSNLFGSDSIFLFDNGSTNIQSLQLLKSWEGRLGGVDYSYSSVQDYENKPHIYINKFRELEGLGFDCLFPMDCDEFIAVDIDGHVAIDKFSIFAELNKFVGSKHILRIKYALDNTPLVDFGFVKSHQKKISFLTVFVIQVIMVFMIVLLLNLVSSILPLILFIFTTILEVTMIMFVQPRINFPLGYLALMMLLCWNISRRRCLVII